MMRIGVIFFWTSIYSWKHYLFYLVVINLHYSYYLPDCFVPANDKPGICHSERSEESHCNKR